MVAKQEELNLLPTNGDLSKQGSAKQPQGDFRKCLTKAKAVAGYLFAFTGAFVGAVGLGSAQSLGGYVPHFQLNTWRFLAQFVLCVPILGYNRLSIAVKKTDIAYVALICIASTVTNVSYYGASIYLPIGTVACSTGTIALVLTGIMSSIFSRKCIQPYSVAAIVLVLGSVVCVTQPNFLFGPAGYIVNPVCPVETENTGIHHTDTWMNLSTGPYNNTLGNVTSSDVSSDTNQNLGYVLAATASTSAVSLVLTVNRKLREYNPFVLSSYMAASGVMLSVITAAVLEEPMFPSYVVCRLLLLSHAVSASLQTMLVVVATLMISPESLVLTLQSKLMFVFVAQYSVLSRVNPGRRNVWEILGAVGIFVGNTIEPVYKLVTKLRQYDQM